MYDDMHIAAFEMIHYYPLCKYLSVREITINVTGNGKATCAELLRGSQKHHKLLRCTTSTQITFTERLCVRRVGARLGILVQGERNGEQ